MSIVLARALEGTEERGNASREFHVNITVLGLNTPVRGELVDDQQGFISVKEYELSRNGAWVAVDNPPVHIVKEVITTAQVIYLD